MYYVFGRSAKPRRWVDGEPFIPGVSFLKGAKITKSVPVPLEYTLKRLNLHAADHAAYLPSILGTRVPLFRDDLLATLLAAGVENLDAYAAIVKDPDSDQDIHRYKAVNILGVIAAADMKKSSALVHGGPPVIDVEFERLELDPAKGRGALMFRLAEALGTVLVHQRVRDHLVSAGFDDLAFNEPSDVAV